MHQSRGQCSVASLALGGSSRVNCRRSRIGGEAELAQEKQRDLVATAPFPHLFTSRSKPPHAGLFKYSSAILSSYSSAFQRYILQYSAPGSQAVQPWNENPAQLSAGLHACLRSSPRVGNVLAAFYPFLEGTSPTTVDRLLMSQVTPSTSLAVQFVSVPVLLDMLENKNTLKLM